MTGVYECERVAKKKLKVTHKFIANTSKIIPVDEDGEYYIDANYSEMHAMARNSRPGSSWNAPCAILFADAISKNRIAIDKALQKMEQHGHVSAKPEVDDGDSMQNNEDTADDRPPATHGQGDSPLSTPAKRPRLSGKGHGKPASTQMAFKPVRQAGP